MDETKKTLMFCGAAVTLALVAWLVTPEQITPDAFNNQGEPFFPEFTDPATAASLEVVVFNEENGVGVPFRVTNRNNLWTIPSHNNYPADGKERLAKTAAGLISLTRDDFRTRTAGEYAACSVINPADETSASVGGRGQRVTVRGQDERVLADIIIGGEVPGRPGFRFVRVPDEKGVYTAKTDLAISTNFKDWIDTDLLRIDLKKIDGVDIDNYSINERTRSVETSDEILLSRVGAGWKAKKMKASQVVDSVSMQNLLKAIDELSIVGVRPKPKGLADLLTGMNKEMAMSQTDVVSLQQKGFFLSTDGQMLSNEGEMRVNTVDGIRYILRFGEVLFGDGLTVTAGSVSEGSETEGKSENRYLFVSTEANTSIFPVPPQPDNLDFQNKDDSLWTEKDKANNKLAVESSNWDRKVKNARKLSADLNSRFAGWYYVISAASFDDLHLSRSNLIVKKKSS